MLVLVEVDGIDGLWGGASSGRPMATGAAASQDDSFVPAWRVDLEDQP